MSARKCKQLVHFTSIIEATSEKYSKFQSQVEDRDTEIFVTIPALLILKCLDDDDKGICKSFFPPMFGEDGNSSSRSGEDHDEGSQSVDKVAVHNQFLELKQKYGICKSKAKNEYDFFNLIERCILGMDEDEGADKKSICDTEFTENGLDPKDMHRLTQLIRVLSMQMQRYKPQEWNEFLVVSLDS